MKKTNFTNCAFYWTIISILAVLLLWNLYLTVAQSNFVGLLPAAIQSILLVLLFRRHEYAKVGVKLWTIISLIAGPALQFSGRFLEDLADGFAGADLTHYLTTGITVLVGAAVLHYTNRTVEVVETVQEDAEMRHT